MSKFHYTEAQKYIEWVWPDFSPWELSCRRCCGNILFTKESADAWDKLQAFRDIVEVPVVLNSAYRCKIHNARVKGADNSYHLRSMAFDIPITDRLPRHVIHDAARKAGFTGFGDYKTFVHIDTGRARSWKG